MPHTLIPPEGRSVPIQPVLAADGEATLEALGAFAQGLADSAAFKGKAGEVLVLPDPADGRPARVLLGLGERGGAMSARSLAARLPAGDYGLEGEALDPIQAGVAFALGAYRFDRYKSERPPGARLAISDPAALTEARRIAAACGLARDLINSPASDMGPHQVETVAREIAEQYGASIKVTTGAALVEANYPAVHAVGAAAGLGRAPRMVEMHWGEAGPLIALVGKGVTFDTGGLDIKPSSGMRLMKKDMGGAACVLGLARLVMDAGLKVRLAVLVPLAENAISGEAMRPGDVLQTRSGLTVEVGNTDAEGRLILADALARAAELEPDLTLDLATLTGAARAAVGPELVPFYTASDALAEAIAVAGAACEDPVWRMPLWAGYEEAITGDIAALKNDPDAWAQAGSITAALFLQRFAPTSGEWAHFDIYAWNPRGRPGWPVGAEAQVVRALYRVIAARTG
ncbi:MAG: Leucyl aminopeptidase [Caulobacteraceae bacterium]|nr:Leucyl aminopeptidase [Caulobacteraceae bacterium]